MRKVKAIIQLTLHSISFHLKFPARLSLELLVNKTASEILANLQLSPNPIKIRNQVVRQVQWEFNEQKKQFQELRLKIVIYLRTNNNPNKLTAGIIEVNLSDPTYKAIRVMAKPLRCNDDRANLQYSIRSILDFQHFSRNRELGSSRNGLGGNKIRSCEKEFNSSILYKNKEMLNAEECSQNELFKYLHDSQNESSGRRERRHRSSMKGGHRGWVDDESKTERRSYGLNRSSEMIVPRRQYSHEERNRQLIVLNQNIKKQVEENRGQIERLTLENKDLKGKIKQLETDLSQQEMIVKSLTKKIEFKEGNSGDQVKQLKNKLQQNEVQLHRLINEKDEMLNNMQAKEKEWLLATREKERINGQERRKLLSQLQGREDHQTDLTRQLTRLKQDYKVMEVLKQQISQQKDKLQLQVEKYRCQVSKLQIELTKSNQDISQLQESLKVKLEAGINAKSQKKMMQQLQMQKNQTELMVVQKETEIGQMKDEIERLRVQMKSKGQNLLELRKEVESSKILIENLKSRERNLLAKINRYENQLKNQTKETNNLDKHVKEIELQLSKIKLQADYTNASKVKKITEYERINDLLNKKIELFAQQNIQLSAQKMEIIDKYKSKEDDNFQLGQQLIVAKQNLLSLQGEMQALIQDNQYLLKQVKLLDLRQQEIFNLKEKLQHSERILYQLEQNYELREIQLVNQIKLLNSMKQERQDQIKQLNENVIQLERQNLAHETQIEGLEQSLKNKQAEFQYLKHEIDRERKNNIQFQERMIVLKRSENTSLSSIQQLRQDNIAYQKMLAQNDQAIKALGKRYQSLYKSVIDSLNRFFEIIKSGKNLANQLIRNQKPDIANLLNDCIRFLSQEKKQQLEEYNKLKNQLLGQSDKNRENAKMINIKIQIQQQLESEIEALKANAVLLQSKVSNQDNQIFEYQGQVKEKLASIKQMSLLMENMKKENKNEINKLQSIINNKSLEIKKLQEQLASQIQYRKTQQKLLESKLETAEQECQAKINANNTKYAELQSNWKGEKENLRLLKIKVVQHQNTIAKLTKQKTDIQALIDTKTKQLIAARVESEYKSKIITEKQLQISEQRKTVDKLDKEKQNLENRRKGMEEGNKTLVIARNQLEEAVRSKNTEIAQIKTQLNSLEISNAKLLKQKQQFQKYKKLQIQNIAKLNQTIKLLKDNSFANDDLMNKANLQKQTMEKQFTKKMNILSKSNQALQKQLKDSTIKNTEKQSELIKKNNSIANQLKQIQIKNQQYVKTIQALRIEIDNYNNITTKVVQKAQDLKSKKKNDDPNAGKYQQFLDFVSDLKILGNNSEVNRAKFKKLTPPSDQQKFPSLPQSIRELNINLNRIKIKVLNKPNLPQEIKTFLLEDIKNIQLIVQKLSKCSGK